MRVAGHLRHVELWYSLPLIRGNVSFLLVVSDLEVLCFVKHQFKTFDPEGVNIGSRVRNISYNR